MSRPGTSGVVSGHETVRFTVELARFGVDFPIASEDAISLVFGALSGPVTSAELGPATVVQAWVDTDRAARPPGKKRRKKKRRAALSGESP